MIFEMVEQQTNLVTECEINVFEGQQIVNKQNKLFKIVKSYDFFGFKESIDGKICSPIFSLNQLTSDLRQLLEYFLSDRDDRSAAFISLIWERFQLWKTENILYTANASGHKLIHYVCNSNIRNLFSFLMFDWHDIQPREEEMNYFLYIKTRQYHTETGKSLFSLLYEIIESEKYSNVCLHIIYQFLHELYTRSNGTECLSCLPDTMDIQKVFLMKNLEFRIKILNVIITYWRPYDDNYSSYKERCEEISPFLKLAFMLKERNNSTFEQEFENYIENCKKKYGFYYEASLKHDNRLLLHIADQNKMAQVRSFIFRKCYFNEINASPVTNVQEISKLMTLNIYPWNQQEVKIIENLKTVIATIKDEYHSEKNKEIRKNIEKQLKLFRRYLSQTNNKNTNKITRIFDTFKTSRNLLFERQYDKMSLYEEILATEGMKEVIELVWEMSDILKDENILQMKNPTGRHMMDYVTDSNDELNLIGFIIPKHSNTISLLTRRHFVKIQNELHVSKTTVSLFERFMFIKDKDLRNTFFEIPFCLLEEIHEIRDIPVTPYMCQTGDLLTHLVSVQTEIDTLLLFKDVQTNGAKIRNKYLKSKFKENVEDIIKEINSDKRKKFDYEYDFNKLLRYSLKYWQTDDLNFSFYKERLLAINDPMLTMIIQIIEGEIVEFKRSFYENVHIIFNQYIDRYKIKDENERLLQEDMFILFRIAIKHGRDQIVEFILNYENFETLKFEFPRINRPTKHNFAAARKLLDHGYELSHGGIPPYWIPEQLLEDFLDSRITHYDENLIRMDLSFLMKSDDRKHKINGKNDVTDYLLFNEHTATLKYIMENEEVKSMLQHPIVSTYINIKTYKFQLIHQLNFFFFFFTFMMPFGFVIGSHASDDQQITIFHRFFQLVCVLSTTVLGIREFLQFTWFYRNRRIDYFFNLTNQIELVMIFLSWVVLLTITLDIRQSLEMFSFLATLLIIISTIAMMTMLPFDAVPLYMRMLKNVSFTFFKFFSFFVFIIFAFSVSFFVIFRPKYENNMETIVSNDTTKDTVNHGEGANSNVYQNFDSLMGSFLKTLLMLSGEYTIEPFTLSITKMIIFFIFIITSFILFNLIIALAITDVKELTDEAEALDIFYKSQKIIKSAEKWKEFYEYIGLKDRKLKTLWYINRWTVKVIRFFLFYHCYVHKPDNVFINLQTLELTIQLQKRYESPLTTIFGSKKKYVMNSKTFQRIKRILKNRSEEEFRQMKSEIMS